MSRKIITLAITLLAVASLAFAQQDRGTFTGIVTDPTGSAIPGVAITIVNTQTNATYTTQANEIGQYTVPNLPIGRYRINFEAPGFRTTVRDGLTLGIAQVARIDVRLELGATTESVTVTAETPLLQTDTPDVGTSLEQRRVIDLPLSFSGGRYPENFAYKLTPGVEGNNWTSRINGSPAFSKEVLLDGASATIYIAGHFGESSVSMEALEEFKIQTSGMSAEFARTGGGIFNFVMKSGTNDLHGSGFYQFRNEWMNANSFANNFYDRARPRDRRHNFGFSVGGPVVLPKIYNGKDKSFFYVAYEKYADENRGAGTPNRTVPTLPWYDGDMSNYLTSNVLGEDALGRSVLQGQIYDPASVRSIGGTIVRDPFVGNIIPKSRFSNVSRNVIELMKQHYAPAISGALVNNSFFPNFNTAKFDQKQFSVKGDHYISERHKLSGSIAWIDRPRVLLDAGGLWDFNDPEEGGPFSKARIQTVETHMFRFAYDWTMKPTLLNHLGLAFNRQFNPSLSMHLDEPGAQILGIQGINQDANYPEINWSGGDRVSLDNLGYNKNDFIVGTTWQVLDTVSWMKGRHAIKFGFDWKRSTMSDAFNPGPGSFNFSQEYTGMDGFNKTGHPFASFLLGAVQSASVPVQPSTTSDVYSIGLFIQDDFKVSPRLTLNMGLRWDGQPVQTEWHDRLHNFNPNLTDPWTGLPGAIEFAGEGPGRTGQRKFIDDQWNDFGPRFGLAYRVTDKLVFRGAYGIFFSNHIPQAWSGVPYIQKYGFTEENKVSQVPNRPAFNWDDGYNGVVTKAELDPSNKQDFWGPVHWDPDGGKVAYTQQWNANVQFELPAQMVLDLGYIGSKSTGIVGNQLKQINQLPVEALALGDTLGTWIGSEADIPAEAKAMGAIYPWTNVPEAERPYGGWLPIEQTLRPFPQYMQWNTILAWAAPLGFSNYHAFQVQFNKRYSSGLTWLANYTFSKTMDNLDSAWATWVNGGRPIDYYNLQLEKTISPYDIPHTVKIGVTYELPVGRGKKLGGSMHPALDAVIGGWTIQYIGNYRSGTPLGFGGTGTPNSNFQTNRAVFENPNGQPLTVDFDESRFDMSQVSTPGAAGHQIINTSIIRDPERYERGNAAYRMAGARGFPEYVEDFGLQKNFNVKERFRFQIRWELLNALNRHRFSSIQTNPSNPLFGQVTGLDGGFYRTMQLGARVDF